METILTEGVFIISFHAKTGYSIEKQLKDERYIAELDDGAMGLAMRLNEAKTDADGESVSSKLIQEVDIEQVVWSAQELGFDKNPQNDGSYYTTVVKELPPPSNKLVASMARLKEKTKDLCVFVSIHFENGKFSNCFKGKAFAKNTLINSGFPVVLDQTLDCCKTLSPRFRSPVRRYKPQ
ncbi:MAG: hypothetical protein V4568_19080 [Pseudomonadota bacterium]